MEAKSSDGLVDAGGDLVKAYRDLITLKIIEHTSLGVSKSVVGVLSFVLALFVLLFVGLAWWLGKSLDNIKAGFFIVGGLIHLLSPCYCSLPVTL